MFFRRLWRGSSARLKLGVGSLVALGLAAGATAAIGLAAQSRGHDAHGRSAGCPAALPRGLGDATGAVDAARAWGLSQRPKRFVVGLLSTSPYSLGTDAVWRNIARQRCGSRVASRTWVAFYYTPSRIKSADLAEGVVYFARTAAGWKEWYAYR